MIALRLTVLVDHYPALSETFVLAEIASLAELGHDVSVESAAWAQDRADRWPSVPVHCLDDDPLPRRMRDLAWLVATHPVGCARDLWARRRWRQDEIVRPLRVIAPVVRRVKRSRTVHLHAHFAAGVALDALRIGQLLGLPYSVTAHAYEIYRSPRNLAEKLRRAAFATGESEYSVATLRDVAGPGAADRVHVVTMGVDHAYFARSRPLPGGRTVLAVGRLVQKKGFCHLLDAAALLAADQQLGRLLIVGDGPLRDDLRAQTRSLGLETLVEWTGALGAGGVRETLERADVVAIPAVPAPDGDRDVLPLIAGEALAMELAVVASDFVGLPEVVRPPWGRLVPPGDAHALAAALGSVLELDNDQRAQLGRAGREFVVRTRDLRRSAEGLTALIEAAQMTGVR